MTLALDPIAAPSPYVVWRLWRAVRYAGVLGVWLGLCVIRPRLALQIFSERRETSPLRWRR
jgi:hypothetical protein